MIYNNYIQTNRYIFVCKDRHRHLFFWSFPVLDKPCLVSIYKQFTI